MNKTKLLTLFLFVSIISFAQSGMKIGSAIGRVLDNETNKPVEYASVSVLSLPDSNLVSGGVTEGNGYFKIDELGPGNYVALISFIGYENQFTPAFEISRSQTEASLGTFNLTPSVEFLQEVEIVEEKPMMEVKLDKRVFDPSQMGTTQGGSATDALENIPSVEVDMDGNISLRGNQNVRILIDGKPSALAGTDPATILRQIPAEAIKDIEVITNPSAKYDPDGMTGIINIVLKKNKWVGINGSVAAGVGNFGNNASANLSYRDKKVNVFTNLNYRKFDFPFYIQNERITTFNGGSYLYQDAEAYRSNKFYSGKLGFDYYINPYNTITLSGNFNTGGGNTDEEQFSRSIDSADLDTTRWTRITTGENSNTGYDLNLNYSKTFEEKGRELTSDLRYSKGDRSGDEFYDQVFTNPDSLIYERSFTGGDNTFITAQVDYFHPLGEDRSYEMGAKMIHQENLYDYLYEKEEPANSGTWNEIDALSTNFDYNETNYSVYGIYAAPLGDFSYQVGLRLEQTYFELSAQDSTINRNYFSAFPTAHISKGIGEKGQAQLSYSRRINRPSSRQLSPAVDYADPLNIRMGNPNLRPEYIDSYELSYTHMMGRNSLQGSLYYRQQNDAIRRFRVHDDSSGVAILTYENLDMNQSYGIELIGSFRTNKWNFMPSFNGYRNITTAGEDRLGEDVSNMAMSTKLMLGYNINKNLSVQASSRYRSKMVPTQGSFKPGMGVDFSARYSFLNRAANLNLSVRNAFNTMKFEAVTESEGFIQTTQFQRPGPVFYLTFTYTFGKQDFSFRKRRKGGSNWEDNGGDGGMDMM